MSEFEMPFGEDIRENGMWYLSVGKKKGKEDYKETKVDEGVIMDAPKKGGKKMAKKDTNLSIKLGITLNLGNYESARIDVGATVPCGEAELDDKYDKMKTYLTGKLNEEMQEIRSKKGA